ncbi:hypothetical protein [Candidatus Spongiihabitans sp.]|uniref:hypothetical protein n=1 Tax=Candidatus Spongiihabitans sp. TaxID=3101308 RepID=UPI003C6F24AC
MKNSIGQTFYQAVLFSVVALVAAECIAQSTTSDISTSQDCSKIDLQVPDGGLLAREERIALLDQALLESLNNSEPCQSAASAVNNGAAGSGAASEGLEGTESATGAESTIGTETDVESVPVGDIQGDMPVSEEPRDAHDTAADETTAANQPVQDNRDAVLSNGKAPEDIPPEENDDIIAKQFRQAAIQETDPVAKAKLWNEYRRYKNLPVQDVPET